MKEHIAVEDSGRVDTANGADVAVGSIAAACSARADHGAFLKSCAI